ncbi:MAG: hypothetical protein WAU68_05045 [Vitreimonas sp.]
MDPNGASDATASVDDAARRIKDSAESVADRAKTLATDTAAQSAQKIADKSQGVASSLRRAADDVEGEQAWLGAALRKSADGLETATRSLQGGDINRALQDLNGFAHRQPALFLGASLALGFALARVGKTAIEQQAPTPEVRS